jgi:hypothetical protein
MPTRTEILAALSPSARAAVARQLGQPAPKQAECPQCHKYVGKCPACHSARPAPSGYVGGVTVYALVRTVSEMNCRDHWAVRNRRKVEQATGVVAAFTPVKALVQLIPPPYVVTMTRLGGRKMDDDNLAGALKATQDAVAWILRLDDGDRAAVTWQRGQLVGKELRAAKLNVTPPAVRIRVETRREPTGLSA